MKHPVDEKSQPTGANTTKVSTSATGTGRPQASGEESCQYTNAENMAMAPWAKLKMPDVV
jgi:hypothetical protein